MTDSARVLVVEDDRAMREAIAGALTAVGHEVRAVRDGTELAGVVAEFDPDIGILDVGLRTGPDGFALATQLRETGVPVVFVTAADTLEDRLNGFDVGADDYLIKPFAVAELLARVGVVLRRVGGPPSTWRVGDLAFDDAARTVRRADAVVALTKVEYALLTTLARSPGRTFSKARILSTVWGFDDYAPNLVEVHVSALRRKLEAHGPRVVHTQRGEGYVFR